MSAPALKVYGWLGFRRESKSDHNRHAQTREIVAARSKAEAGRIAGLRGNQLREASETRDPNEIEAANAKPGVVLWAPLNGPERDTYRPAGSDA